MDIVINWYILVYRLDKKRRGKKEENVFFFKKKRYLRLGLTRCSKVTKVVSNELTNEKGSPML